MQVVAPIGVRASKKLNDPVTDPPKYSFNGTGLNTNIPDTPNAAAWTANSNQTLTCDMVAADLPAVGAPHGVPPPPLRAQGAQLATVDGKQVLIHGVNWFGFNNGKTMVDGLDAEQRASWQGGDFATIVFTLRLLGFNAVRLPFKFTDLFNLRPQTYSKPCPSQVPTAQQLAARATPAAELQAAADKQVPYTFLLPESPTPGRCNAYLPSGPTTLTRFLWVVDFFVQSGFYVLVDYHPHADGEPMYESVVDYTSSWLRLYKSLQCMPNWVTDLKGRVFLDLLNEPDELQITWDGRNSSRAPLSEYYLNVMHAIHGQSSIDETLFFIQGGGQDRLGISWGDGYVTDPKWIQERQLADANGFFQALLQQPYARQVVLAPHLYGVSISESPDVGPKQWEKYALSWGYLLKNGYCTSNQTCIKFPVVLGEIGTSFNNTLDVQYYEDMVKFMQLKPPTDVYPSVPFNNWFWWSWNANSGDTGGLVADDWNTLRWNKLLWLQEHLGLKPWYKQL
eukprot:gene10875-11029_t